MDRTQPPKRAGRTEEQAEKSDAAERIDESRGDAALLMTPLPRELSEGSRPAPAPRSPRSYALPPGVVAPGPTERPPRAASTAPPGTNGDTRRTLTGIPVIKPHDPAAPKVPEPATPHPVPSSSSGPAHASNSGPVHSSNSGPVHSSNSGPVHSSNSGPAHGSSSSGTIPAVTVPMPGPVRPATSPAPRSSTTTAPLRPSGRPRPNAVTRPGEPSPRERADTERFENRFDTSDEHDRSDREERKTTPPSRPPPVPARPERAASTSPPPAGPAMAPASAPAASASGAPAARPPASTPPSPAPAAAASAAAASASGAAASASTPAASASAPASAASAPAHVDRVTTAEDRAELRALFTELAGHHMVQLRDFMIEVRCGSALAEWISLSEPAVKSVRSMAEQLELDDICAALDVLLAALAGARHAGGAISPEHQSGLLAAYLPLVDLLPGVLELDAERNRREPIIVHSILRQIPGIEKVAIDKLVAANLVSVASLAGARPEELAQVTGLDRELATRVVARFRDYRQSAGAVATPDPRAELRQLAELLDRLRQQNQEYDFAAGSWAPGVKERKRQLRRERAETLLAIHVSLARLGEVDRLVELDRLNFRRKAEFIDVTLQAARNAARARTNPA